MKLLIDHLFPKEWINELTPQELEFLRKAFEQSRNERLRDGAHFDFFGGATLDLDSVFIPPDRGDELVEFFDERSQAA